MRVFRSFAAACVLCVIGASFAHAQAPLRIDRFAVVQEKAGMASVPAMAGGGLVGGAIGLVVLGYLGAVIADDPESSEDLKALAGFVVGGAIGEATMLPLGVHLVNHRRGNYGASALASLGIVAVGLALAFATEDHAPVPGIILGAIPVAQLASSILIERRTSR